jgi:hypothetical protein
MLTNAKEMMKILLFYGFVFRFSCSFVKMALRRRIFTIQERTWITDESARNGDCHYRTEENWPFPSPAPTRKTIKRIVIKYQSTGSTLNLKASGRPKSVRTDENIARVKEIIE